MTLEQCITTHDQIRTRMIAARYPEISEPKTTVEFLIDGLRFNPSTATIRIHPISLDLKDTKDVVHKFNRLPVYRKPTQLRPAPMHGDAGGSNSIKNSAPTPYWYSRTPRRNLLVPKIPCRFHISLGVPRPRHTDLKCNHRAHPVIGRASRHDQSHITRPAQLTVTLTSPATPERPWTTHQARPPRRQLYVYPGLGRTPLPHHKPIYHTPAKADSPQNKNSH